MKKILTTIATLTTLTTAANADFLRIEAGAGMWNQTNVGYISYEDDETSATDTSNEVEIATNYVWAYIKHPIPILPNIRLEYSEIKSEGYLTGTYKGFDIPAGTNFPTTLEMTQIELIPYYNILDNTFWVTVDLGIDIKFMDYTATGSLDAIVTNATLYDESGSFIAPLPYLRARTQLPFMDIGLEAIVKYGSLDGNTFSDMNIKVDYTFDFIPVVQPGIEIGYRQIIMDAKSDDGTSVIDLDFSGLYFGVMARF
jgi:outer membrane protein